LQYVNRSGRPQSIIESGKPIEALW